MDPSGAGYHVQETFVGEIIKGLYSESVILPLCDVRETDKPLSEIRINAIDEVSRQDGSRQGGALAFWNAEGATISSSYPRYKQLTLSPKEITALCAVSDELAEDSKMLDSVLRSSFAAEMTFAIERSLVVGSGAGQPLGLLNSPCKITVARESGQAAGTIVAENLRKAYASLPASSRKRAVWVCGEDVVPMLEQSAVGFSGMFMPAGSNGDISARLFGLPLIQCEYSPALGSEGDLILADLSQMIVVSGGPKLAVSADVNFTTSTTLWRWTWRIDAAMAWKSPITSFSGSRQVSPVVTIATRA